MTLTEASIRAEVSAKSFARGYDYYEKGRVGSLVRRGDVLTATVAGSVYEPYQVQVSLNESGVASVFCSCPSNWGVYCKHGVAVLLAYVNGRDEVESRPELTTLLDTLTTTQLRTILTNLLTYRPDLLEVIEGEVAHLTANPVAETTTSSREADELNVPLLVSPTLISGTIRQHFTQFQYGNWEDHYYDDYDTNHPAEALEPFTTQAEQLLQQNKPTDALNLLQTVVPLWLEQLDRLDPYFVELISEYDSDEMAMFDVTLAECLLSVELPPAGRKQWQKQLENWSYTLSLLTAVTALEEGWDYPPLVRTLQGQTTDAPPAQRHEYENNLIQVRLVILARQERYDEYLHLAKAEGQAVDYATMLIQRGRVDDAFAYAKDHAKKAASFLTIAKALFQVSRQTLAFQLAERGLTLEIRDKRDLARWLRDHAHVAQEARTAQWAAEVAFEASRTLADYLKAEEVGGDKWPTMRPRLLTALENGTAFSSEPVNIYLHENMIVDAMRVVDGRRYYGSDLPRVIAAAIDEHPDWVIGRCKAEAEAIMDAGRSKDYDVAVSWLRQAKQTYVGSGRGANWQPYLNQLLETHGRKYKLVPMLKQL